MIRHSSVRVGRNALFVAGCFAFLWQCASHTRLPPEVRAGIDTRHKNAVVELRHSHFYGELYDENEKWLLSPYPFADTYHIVDTEGQPIHPRGQRGIIPAGTRFIVQQIEFPDTTAMARRMLTTPRYNPWIYLVPAPETGISLEGRGAFILLLPMDLATEAGTEEAIARVFAPLGEVSTWLASRRPTVRVAIEHKDVVAGMSQDELVAALGAPQLWFGENGGTTTKVAWYTSREVWLVDGIVTEVKPGRPVDVPPTEKLSPEATRRVAHITAVAAR